jgi:uncharacterized phiE125 gp8 family phage protein
MDVRIKTAAVSDVITAANIAPFLKYEDAQVSELSIITDMITEVRAHFEKVTGLSLVAKTYIVHFRNEDKPYILPVSPVIEITSVKEIDINGTETTLTLNTDYYKRGLYEVEIITDCVTTIPNPFRNYNSKLDLQIEFTAGYGNAATETLPADLLGALKRQVLQWYENRDDFYELKLLGSVQAILNRYKKSFL